MNLARMLSHLTVLWLTLITAVAAKHRGISKQRQAADKIRLQPDKYFHESRFSHHYDERFADGKLPEPERKAALRVLVQTYLATFRDLGIETWIMHGSLLGWWWNKKALAWDDDADVMISEPSIYRLAADYNMTTYYFEYPAIPEGRMFILDVNPHYTTRHEHDQLNVVDARWIDMENGLFIDITTARYDPDHPKGEGVLICKDGHEFRDTYIFPLLDTTFEGVEAKIPYKYRDFLAAEYGEKALTNKNYHDHVFDDGQMAWIPNGPARPDI